MPTDGQQSNKQGLANRTKILLLSGYDAASHQFWRERLQTELPEYDWTQIALADRYFSWRIRGNSLTFGFEYREQLELDYDCLIVTSMVDLASLRGFVPKLARIPTLVYVHENQFDYPESQGTHQQHNQLNAQLTSIYSLLCADKILFNSQYNFDTFYQGASNLLKKLPDGIPNGLIARLKHLSSVLAVPIEAYAIGQQVTNRRNFVEETKPIGPSELELHLVWNHRWEYDKQPEVLFDALVKFKQLGFRFKLHVLGQSFRHIPKCFILAKKALAEHIVTWGYQPREKYDAILSQADLVISTALHDFQGLSMLEAIARGAKPIAPNRVAYPEYIAADDLYSVDSINSEHERLCQHLVSVYQQWPHFESDKNSIVTTNAIESYFSSRLIPLYREVIDSMTGTVNNIS
jgi:glycosyltransferase involved in cell wall biosynthesis